MQLTAARILDAAATQIAATIDGVEWTSIRCHRDESQLVIDGDGQIPDVVTAWIAAGNTPTPYETPAPTQAAYAAAVQTHIDAAAQSKGYADGVALASYTASNVPAWASEAQAFVLWRDAVWMYSYQQLAAVKSGDRQAPTVAAFILELPLVPWPS